MYVLLPSYAGLTVTIYYVVLLCHRSSEVLVYSSLWLFSNFNSRPSNIGLLKWSRRKGFSELIRKTRMIHFEWDSAIWKTYYFIGNPKLNLIDWTVRHVLFFNCTNWFAGLRLSLSLSAICLCCCCCCLRDQAAVRSMQGGFRAQLYIGILLQPL